MPSALFRSNDVKKWMQVLSNASKAVESSEHEDFIQLDEWVFGKGPKNLPALLQKQQHINKKQLSQLMKYKLLRGKWRPRLQSFVDNLDNNLVVETSAEAFEQWQDSENLALALKTLSKKEMKGVGPAMATLILSVFDPKIPFMGDEALLAVVGERKYTIKDFKVFFAKVTAKVAALNKAIKPKASAGVQSHISCSDVERALWCEAVEGGTPRGTCFRRKKAVKSKAITGKKRRSST